MIRWHSLRWLAPLLLAFGAVTLSPMPAQAATGAPQTGLKTATMTLTIGASGKQHRYTVEVAQTVEQQATGMMYRRSMPQDHGMWFPFRTAKIQSFWMENTYLPLDLVFVGPDSRVVNIAADATPMSRAPITSAGPAIGVLELNGGEAARIGLKPGDAVGIGPAK